MTVQVFAEFGPRLAGAQLSEAGATDAVILIVVFTDTLLSAAVIVALWLLLIVAVVALNVPAAEPAATVMDAGTVRTGLLLVSVTKDPPAGAA